MAVAEIAIKQEIMSVEAENSEAIPAADPVNLEERILHLCAKYPKGITDQMIVTDQPAIDTVKRMKALQRLLSMGKVDLLKQGANLIYRLKTTASTPSKTKGFEREEKLVYQIVEDSGNKGIWIRDIRIRSNLPNTQISKILKTLESKKLIKSVKSVQASKRRVYMLYDLTPDESLTGGAWYSDQDFESEFVDVLNQKCLHFLQQKSHKAHLQHGDPVSRRRASYASVSDVCHFITELGISKVKLTETNIQSILNTLLYDGKAEVTMETAEDDVIVKLYRVSRTVVMRPGFSRVPCGVCSVIDQCKDGGSISPSSCIYMKEWIEF